MSDRWGLTVRDRIKLGLRDRQFASSKLTAFLLRLRLLGSPWTADERGKGLAFVHIPKSAGTSIRMALFSSKSFIYPPAATGSLTRLHGTTHSPSPWSEIPGVGC